MSRMNSLRATFEQFLIPSNFLNFAETTTFFLNKIKLLVGNKKMIKQVKIAIHRIPSAPIRDSLVVSKCHPKMSRRVLGSAPHFTKSSPKQMTPTRTFENVSARSPPERFHATPTALMWKATQQTHRLSTKSCKPKLLVYLPSTAQSKHTTAFFGTPLSVRQSMSSFGAAGRQLASEG